MKLRLHHVEICVKDPNPIVKLLCDQFGLNLVGEKETDRSVQFVLKLCKIIFIITSRKKIENQNGTTSNFNSDEDLTVFCCNPQNQDDIDGHVDSVFNMAVEVVELENASIDPSLIIRKGFSNDKDGVVGFSIIKSCVGNVLHTLLDKKDYKGWFLPGFNQLKDQSQLPHGDGQGSHIPGLTMSHLDHITMVGRVGESGAILDWYEKVFGMKRFIANSQDTEKDGLVIGNDVGFRLKVMEFWKCSESGIASLNSGSDWEPMKIVIAEAIADDNNNQIEAFIRDHNGTGIQHIGIHSENIFETISTLTKQGVQFRVPPSTYYTDVGQLSAIKACGEDLEQLEKNGILLDNEADIFELDAAKDNYLMQVFTHPIFKNKDTFFLEIIQRKGARGFGVGNVTALARSINAYNEMMKTPQQQKQKL